MSTPTTQVEAVRSMTNKDMVIAILELQQQVKELTEKLNKPTNASTKEMTDDDARRVLTGDLASVKHKDAADKLGLTYGQVYSCRLEFTFKNIHKEMKEAGKTNPWKK